VLVYILDVCLIFFTDQMSSVLAWSARCNGIWQLSCQMPLWRLYDCLCC